jgi:hypothetical protein
MFDYVDDNDLDVLSDEYDLWLDSLPDWRIAFTEETRIPTVAEFRRFGIKSFIPSFMEVFNEQS